MVQSMEPPPTQKQNGVHNKNKTAAMGPDEHGSAPLSEAEQSKRWLTRIENRPTVKPLLEGVATILALKKSNARGHQPPIDQVRSLCRLLCWEFAKTDTPFGMKGPNGGTPKCMAMLYMFGKPLIYYCDVSSLIRLVAIAGEEHQTLVKVAVDQIFESAETLPNCSVAIFFALGVAVDVEMMHWEVRTIRKTSLGRVKDGEVAFSTFDKKARESGCTAEVEHMTSDVFEAMRKRILSQCIPVCLDVATTGSEPAIDRTLPNEKLVEMLEMLKVKRTEMIKAHNEEVEQLKKNHESEMTNVVGELAREKAELVLALEDAKAERTAAVSRVAESARLSEESIRQRLNSMTDLHTKMKEQAVDDKQRALAAESLVQGIKLEHKEEMTKVDAVRRTLEAQVHKLRKDQTKSVLEQSKTLSDAKKKHAEIVKNLQDKLHTIEKQLQGQRAAASAVSTSADQARGRCAQLEMALEMAHRAGVLRSRFFAVLMTLAGVRHASSTEEHEARYEELCKDREEEQWKHACDMKAAVEECNRYRADAETLRAELQSSVGECLSVKEKLAEARKASLDAPLDAARNKAADAELTRLKDEVRQHKTREKAHEKKAKADAHMVSELQKVKASLERRLVESDTGLRKLKREGATEATTAQGAVHGDASTATPQPQPHPQPQPQPQLQSQPQVVYNSPFPSQPWPKDDALEGLVSTMYQSLSAILQKARTAPGHRQNLDELQVKNDMLINELRHKNEMLIALSNGMPIPPGQNFMAGAYVPNGSFVPNEGYAANALMPPSA